MNKEDIIRMAREAGFAEGVAEIIGIKVFKRFAALVAAHERKECAKVCKALSEREYQTGKVDHNEMAWTDFCAIAIRARGEK